MDANRIKTQNILKDGMLSLSKAVDLSDDVKKNIAKEYMRLALKYPHMKGHRLMKKAGKAFNVEFDITG